MLGHTSSKITKEHYIQPDDRVDPATANILEARAPKRGGDRDVAELFDCYT